MQIFSAAHEQMLLYHVLRGKKNNKAAKGAASDSFFTPRPIHMISVKVNLDKVLNLVVILSIQDEALQEGGRLLESHYLALGSLLDTIGMFIALSIRALSSRIHLA